MNTNIARNIMSALALVILVNSVACHLRGDKFSGGSGHQVNESTSP